MLKLTRRQVEEKSWAGGACLETEGLSLRTGPVASLS